MDQEDDVASSDDYVISSEITYSETKTMSTYDEDDVFYVNNQGQRRRLTPKLRFDGGKTSRV